jgi:predicted dehydrogenase
MTAAVTLRFGVVGLTSDHVWGMGDELAALPEVRLVGAADGVPELREEAARRWSLDRVHDSYEALLDEARPDAILVCCDNAGKAPVVEAAAARGVHVYQDKPMAATLAEARRSGEAAAAGGIALMVAYHRAFDPIYEEVGTLLREGAVGQVYLARGVIGHGGPLESGCSEYFSGWLFDAAKNGGGSFIDEGCYLIDQFVDQLGPIVEVGAFTAQMGVREYLPEGVEDNAVAILRFRSGALGVLDARWGQVGPAPVLTSFHGTGGTLSNRPGSWELYSTSGGVAPPSAWERVEADGTAGMHGAFPEGMAAWRRAVSPRPRGAEQRWFVDRLLRHEPIRGAASPDVALHVQAVIEAAYESARTGRTVAVE